jgi:predicted RNase H-like nuclease (RuvC/YqgF family)
MGLVSCQEDIEKIAEGASAAPIAMIEIRGIPYHSEEARLLRLAARANGPRSNASSKLKKATKSVRKDRRIRELELENQSLKAKVARLQSKIEQIQASISEGLKKTLCDEGIARREVLRAPAASATSLET